MEKQETLIIGAGLTGLVLAYLLQKKGVHYKIVESRSRIGGRISTKKSKLDCPIDMGATWIGAEHTYLNKLISELNLKLFPQVIGDKAIYEQSSMSPPQLVSLPPNQHPSFRLVGGTYSIIDSLSQTIPKENIALQTTVKSINNNESIIIETDQITYESKIVISTLPPYLLTAIEFNPSLPSSLVQVLSNCHTWMGDAIKIGLRFKSPFWRSKNSSGTIFSNVGPISELYDHSNFEDNLYSLKGFLNGAYFSTSKEQRKLIVLNQLRKYYGDVVDSFISYEEKVWKNDPYTFIDYKKHILPHQNNGHELFSNKYYDNKLIIAGAETSKLFAGYMEGAVRSAYYTYQKLVDML